MAQAHRPAAEPPSDHSSLRATWGDACASGYLSGSRALPATCPSAVGGYPATKGCMMAPLNVLITNCALSGQSGTEMYVCDLARCLLRRGHRPLVYCPSLGPLAERLSTATIGVVNDLNQIQRQP